MAEQNFIPKLNVETLTAEKNQREADLGIVQKDIKTLEEQLAGKKELEERLISEIVALTNEINRLNNVVIPAPAKPSSFLTESSVALIDAPVIVGINVLSGDNLDDTDNMFEAGQKIRIEVELNYTDLAVIADFENIDGAGELVAVYNETVNKYIIEHVLDDMVNNQADKILPVKATSAAVKINWNQSSEEDLKGYKVYRKIFGEEDFALVATVEDRLQSEYIDKALIAGTTYVYKITAYDLYGNESSATDDSIVEAVGHTIENNSTIITFPDLAPDAPGNIIAQVDTTLAVDEAAIQDPDNIYSTGEKVKILLKLEGDTIKILTGDYPGGDFETRKGYPVADAGGFSVVADFSNVDSGAGTLADGIALGNNEFLIEHTIQAGITGAGQTVPITIEETAVVINWRKHTEKDVAGYLIHRSPVDESAYEEIAQLNDRNIVSYRDSSGIVDGNQYYYNLKAFDIYQNVSEFGSGFPVVAVKNSLVDNSITIDIV